MTDTINRVAALAPHARALADSLRGCARQRAELLEFSAAVTLLAAAYRVSSGSRVDQERLLEDLESAGDLPPNALDPMRTLGSREYGRLKAALHDGDLLGSALLEAAVGPTPAPGEG